MSWLLVNILLYVWSVRGGIISATRRNVLGIPEPFYAEKAHMLSFFFVAYNIFLIGNIILCVWPIPKLDYLKKVVISGFGTCMCIGHVFLSLPFVKSYSQFTWGLSCIAGLIASTFSLTEKYENTFYTVVGSYASSYMLTIILRSGSAIFYVITFALFAGIFFIVCRFSPRWHYALCKSLFVGLVVVTLVNIDIPLIDILYGFHHKGSVICGLNRLLGLAVFFAATGMTLMMTIYYDVVKEKVVEYRNVIAGDKADVPEKV